MGTRKKKIQDIILLAILVALATIFIICRQFSIKDSFFVFTNSKNRIGKHNCFICYL